MRLWFFTLLFPFITNAQLHSFSRDTILMGSAFTFTALHESAQVAQKAVEEGIAEVVRIESLISSWKGDSQTSKINSQAGISPVSVDKELFDLIERSIKVSQLSNGYFDISFASIDKIWKFNGQNQEMPSHDVLKASVEKINYKNIILDRANLSVFLKEEGMRIGFGAIGKGYAADKVKALMLAQGIENGVVNAAGDLLAWGRKENGNLWSIGIADPNHKNEVLSSLEVSNKAVVTSGDYERFVMIDGLRYGHIINPKTGIPVTGILSVTIITEKAEIADALATTVFVLGETEGLKLVNALDGVECIIINNRNKLLSSDGVNLNVMSSDEN